MKNIFLIASLFIYGTLKSQELFLITDPASNIPKNALSINFTNSLFKDKKTFFNYHLMPEISYGINKNFMIRGSIFSSNRNNSLYFEGGSIMSKLRFFSIDDVHSHLRIGGYGRFSINRTEIHQEQIEILGHNSGFETGLIITKLNNKLAVNTTFSYEQIFNNQLNNTPITHPVNKALNYTLSIGRLVYPKKYNDFNQTNINLMVEIVGQKLNFDKKNYLDIIGVVQFIINSQSRIDIAYRNLLFSNMIRTAPNGIYLNFYYTFFNVRKS